MLKTFLKYLVIATFFSPRSLLMLVRLQPIFFYQATVLTCFFSWPAAALLVSGYLTNFIFVALVATSSLLAQRSILVASYLKEFQECSYKKHKVEDYLSSEAFARANELSFQKALNTIGFSMYNFAHDVKIFAVKKGRSKRRPLQLKAYSVPYLYSYIFLWTDPEQTQGLQKFFVYHEVGHVLREPVLAKARLSSGNKSLFFFLIWVSWTTTWTLHTALIFTALITVFLVLSSEWKARIQSHRLKDEMAADYFALKSLTEEERLIVAKYFSTHPLPHDVSLQENNRRRAEEFNVNIAGEKKDEMETTSANDLDENRESPLLLTALLLIITLGTISGEPTWELVWSNAKFVLAPLSILLLLVMFLTMLVGDHIDSVIDPQVSLIRSLGRLFRFIIARIRLKLA